MDTYAGNGGMWLGGKGEAAEPVKRSAPEVYPTLIEAKAVRAQAKVFNRESRNEAERAACKLLLDGIETTISRECHIPRGNIDQISSGHVGPDTAKLMRRLKAWLETE